MEMSREAITLKSTLDELLMAHDEFDAATFYGGAHEMHAAQLKMEAARRRARLVSGRFTHTVSQFSTLEKLVEAQERAELERNTRLQSERLDDEK